MSHAVDDLCTDLSVLAYSPDGKTLAMGGLNAVELWDIAQFGFRDDFAGRARGGEVDRLVFSPDGKTLVSAGTGATVMFWDVPAGAPKNVRRDMSLPPVPSPPGFNRTKVIPPP